MYSATRAWQGWPSFEYEHRISEALRRDVRGRNSLLESAAVNKLLFEWTLLQLFLILLEAFVVVVLSRLPPGRGHPRPPYVTTFWPH